MEELVEAGTRELFPAQHLLQLVLTGDTSGGGSSPCLNIFFTQRTTMMGSLLLSQLGGRTSPVWLWQQQPVLEGNPEFGWELGFNAWAWRFLSSSET